MSRLANRTARLRRIEEILFGAPAGLRVVELAAQLNVDRRTIYRDIDFLGAQGVPIWQDEGRFGINRTRYLAKVHLTYQEAIALVLAGLLLSRTIDEQNPYVSAALRKLALTLPGPLPTHLQRAADRVQGRRQSPAQVAVLAAVAEAWGSGHKVDIGYRSSSSGQVRQRTVAPYALEPTPSGIYVIGHDDWSDELRTFKLERVTTAKVLPQTFTFPDDFDLEAHLQSGWRIMAGPEAETVRLRFAPAVAAHVEERRWHPTQTLTHLDDGGCVLEVSVAEPREMQPWIRSWGAGVEVLAPTWLRAQIGADMAAAAAQYEL